MNRQKTLLKLAALIAALCLTTTVLAAILTPLTRHTTGIITNLGIYTDAGCTTPLMSINWGTTIQPGSTITKDAWVKNVASYTMTLSNSTSSWNPSHAPTYIHLAWDGIGKTLDSGIALKTTFTLTVDSNIVDSDPLIGSFSFDITITGTG